MNPVRFDIEDDGRWIAELPEVPGALAYGATRDEAFEALKKIAPDAVQVFCECGETAQCGCGDPVLHCMFCCGDLTPEQIKKEEEHLAAFLRDNPPNPAGTKSS
jgi:hypothetical protein